MAIKLTAPQAQMLGIITAMRYVTDTELTANERRTVGVLVRHGLVTTCNGHHTLTGDETHPDACPLSATPEPVESPTPVGHHAARRARRLARHDRPCRATDRRKAAAAKRASR